MFIHFFHFIFFFDGFFHCEKSLWKLMFFILSNLVLCFLFFMFLFFISIILYFYFLLLKLFNSSVLFCYVILCCISLIHNSILLRMNERRHQDAIGYLFLYFSFLSLTSFSPSSISFPDSMRCTSDQIFFNEILFQLVWRHSKEWINSIL